MDREKLIERQSELTQIVEAIDSVLHSKEWQVIRGIFEKEEDSLKRQLLSKAQERPLKAEEIYYLQGRIDENRNYDLATYAERCRNELQGIKNNLQ